MRTILVMALIANLLLSVGSSYLQGAIAGQSAVSNNPISTLASTADRAAEQNPKF
jgi:hypothetical protein